MVQWFTLLFVPSVAHAQSPFDDGNVRAGKRIEVSEHDHDQARFGLWIRLYQRGSDPHRLLVELRDRDFAEESPPEEPLRELRFAVDGDVHVVKGEECERVTYWDRANNSLIDCPLAPETLEALSSAVGMVIVQGLNSLGHYSHEGELGPKKRVRWLKLKDESWVDLVEPD